MIGQAAIVIFGASAIWLSQDSREERRRYACLCGLASQPFWFWTTWHAEQYGIFAISFLYCASWMRGFHNHWLKRGN